MRLQPAGHGVGRVVRQQKAVEAARSEFPDRVWQLFWRLAVDGNPAPQVAEEFGMTPAAVRQVKSRVLRRLKQLVGDLPD